MSGAGPLRVTEYFASLPHTAPKRVENLQREGGRSGMRVLLALGFRRGSGKGIVSITAGNAALSRRCPGRSRPRQHGAP